MWRKGLEQNLLWMNQEGSEEIPLQGAFLVMGLTYGRALLFYCDLTPRDQLFIQALEIYTQPERIVWSKIHRSDLPGLLSHAC